MSTVAQMVGDAEYARHGRPVLALSRTDPASIDRLTGWVEHTMEHFRHGGHVARDPGPMAPHHHADGREHVH